jgi:PAS domain S-box-containing protein
MAEMLTRISDGTPIPLFVIDSRHNVTYWNTAIEALSGIKKGEIIGTSEQWRVFYAEKRPAMADLIVDGASADEIEVYYPGRCWESSLIDGACEAEGFYPSLGEAGKWLYITASPIKDDHGRVIGAVETLQDITERKQTEEALQESEKSYRELFDGALDAIWVHDLKGNILKANRATEKLTGLSGEELARGSVKDFLSKRGLHLAGEWRHRLIENDKSLGRPYKQHIIRKDRTEATVMCTTRPIFSDGQLVAFQNIAWDISEQERTQENLRYYMQQVTITQEHERKRIARDLHDDIAQSLLLVTQGLDMLSSTNRPKLSNSQLKQYLEKLHNQAVDALEAVRCCAQDLRPRIIDDLGLVAALEWLTDDLAKHEEIDAHAEITGEERTLPAEVQLLLFRIAQEALNNARKHAQASMAILKLEFSGDNLTLTVSDNGRGFKVPRMIGDLADLGKLGLAGMQERARLIGGRLEIESERGKGTTVTVKVPISE